MNKIIFYYEFQDGFELYVIANVNIDLNFLLEYTEKHGMIIYAGTNFNCEVIIKDE